MTVPPLLKNGLWLFVRTLTTAAREAKAVMPLRVEGDAATPGGSDRPIARDTTQVVVCAPDSVLKIASRAGAAARLLHPRSTGLSVRCSNGMASARPHIHFLIRAPGHGGLVTALCLAGDEHLENDVVFGAPAIWCWWSGTTIRPRQGRGPAFTSISA
jgi:hypothetical protein